MKPHLKASATVSDLQLLEKFKMQECSVMLNRRDLDKNLLTPAKKPEKGPELKVFIDSRRTLDDLKPHLKEGASGIMSDLQLLEKFKMQECSVMLNRRDIDNNNLLTPEKKIEEGPELIVLFDSRRVYDLKKGFKCNCFTRGKVPPSRLKRDCSKRFRVPEELAEIDEQSSDNLLRKRYGIQECSVILPPRFDSFEVHYKFPFLENLAIDLYIAELKKVKIPDIKIKLYESLNFRCKRFVSREMRHMRICAREREKKRTKLRMAQLKVKLAELKVKLKLKLVKMKLAKRKQATQEQVRRKQARLKLATLKLAKLKQAKNFIW